MALSVIPFLSIVIQLQIDDNQTIHVLYVILEFQVVTLKTTLRSCTDAILELCGRDVLSVIHITTDVNLVQKILD